MNNKVEEKNDADPIKIFGIVLPALPSLVLRFGGLYLRFKREAKKGGRIFQKELMQQGLDRSTAEELTAVYLEGSDLLRYMQMLR